MWPPCPLVGHLRFCPPLGSDGESLGHRGNVAVLPTCGPILILPSPLKLSRPPRRQGLCSHGAHLWATSDLFPRYAAVGTSLGGKGYVGTLPSFGPPPILLPAVKRWGPPRRQGLCSHLAHLWATTVSAPAFEAVGIPQAARVMWLPCPLVGHL